MDQQQELDLKRREVREEILAIKEKLPSARILNQFGKVFPSNSLGYWLANILLLNLFLVGPGMVLMLVLRETGTFFSYFGGALMTTECVVVGTLAAHIAVQAIFEDLAYQIVEKINNTDDLAKMLRWLDKAWSMLNISSFILPFGLIWAALGAGNTSASIQQFIGFGYTLWCLLVGLLAGVVFYVPLWASLLALRLKEYHYEMNVYSPADSEIISNISDMLTRSIYILAAVEAFVTLLVTSGLGGEQIQPLFTFPLVIFGWAIILVQFMTTRNTLGTITNRAKWRTLNRIRAKINALEATGDLSDKDTAERLTRLADIHKQIMLSKTNTFDLKSVSTLLSQLMLPLLGLLLGNFDKVLKLLQK